LHVTRVLDQQRTARVLQSRHGTSIKDHTPTAHYTALAYQKHDSSTLYLFTCSVPAPFSRTLAHDPSHRLNLNSAATSRTTHSSSLEARLSSSSPPLCVSVDWAVRTVYKYSVLQPAPRSGPHARPPARSHARAARPSPARPLPTPRHESTGLHCRIDIHHRFF